MRISVHFLQPYSHARDETGGPEWPPSPLRLFQALVAAGMRRARDATERERIVAALRWLEDQPAPSIDAPAATLAETPYRLYVPDNVGDRVASAWARGAEGSIGDFRTEKDVRPVHLDGHDVHYVFDGTSSNDTHVGVLRDVARSVTHLGWGVDMVVADASADGNALGAERWIPGRLGGRRLRRACAGTFDALEQRHLQFLGRLDGDTFRPVSPLMTFEVEPYARATDVAPAPHAVFRLSAPTTMDRLMFDPARRARDIAAWLRHTTASVCAGWPFGSVDAFVHGHGPSERGERRERFSYLPLPTINPRQRVEGIGRVMLAAPLGRHAELEWARERLGGQELLWDGEPMAVLEPLAPVDWVTEQYVGSSDTWSTVTPVILPGHDDRSPAKAERLVRRALEQAGFERELVQGIVQLEWRRTGFRPGLALANRHLAPDKVAGPMFHVLVRFDRQVAGPIAIGSGRHRGVGTFAVHPMAT